MRRRSAIVSAPERGFSRILIVQPNSSDDEIAESPYAAPDSEIQPQKSQRSAAMIFILVTVLLDVVAIGVVIPVLPGLISELSGPENASFYVGVIGASYALTQFLFAPIVGALSDQFGRRPVLLASMFGLGIDFLVQGFAPNVAWLFAGRIFAGMMGANFTTANAYIADVSTDENRASNFGMMGAAFGIGFIIGPAAGGMLGQWDLRAPFFVSAALALLNWLYGFFVLPESLSEENRSPFSVAKINPFGSIGRLRAYPIVAGLAVAFVCISLAQRGLENVWVLYATDRYGWDEWTNGLTLGLVGLVAAVVQGGLVRPIIGQFGERRTVIVGGMISCVAFAGYGLATEGWMVWCIIVFGGFGGVVGPAIQSIIARAVDPSEQGQIQGALTSLTSLTSIIAPLVFTAGLYGYFTSDDAPFQLPGAPLLAGSVLYLLAVVLIVRLFRRVPDAA